MFYDNFETPLGPMTIAGDEGGLRHASWSAADTSEWVRAPAAMQSVREQLLAYFAGELQHFDVELAPAGTPFQQSVWRALCAIPYGATISYGELATQIDKPTAARAVGHANGKNPIAIVIPCHRVIGAKGALTGYASGLDRKRSLLDIETRHLPRGAKAALLRASA